MKGKLLFWPFVPVLFMIVVAVFYFVAFENQIHVALGKYGVSILSAQGLHNLGDVAGTWWNGYSAFEVTMVQWALLTLAVGILIGFFVTFSIFTAFLVHEEEDFFVET